MDFSHPHMCTKSLARLSIALRLGYPGLQSQASGTREGRLRLFLTLKSAVEISFFLQQPSLQAGGSQDHPLSCHPSNEIELLGGKFNSNSHIQYRNYWI